MYKIAVISRTSHARISQNETFSRAKVLSAFRNLSYYQMTYPSRASFRKICAENNRCYLAKNNHEIFGREMFDHGQTSHETFGHEMCAMPPTIDTIVI